MEACADLSTSQGLTKVTELMAEIAKDSKGIEHSLAEVTALLEVRGAGVGIK